MDQYKKIVNELCDSFIKNASEKLNIGRDAARAALQRELQENEVKRAEALRSADLLQESLVDKIPVQFSVVGHVSFRCPNCNCENLRSTMGLVSPKIVVCAGCYKTFEVESACSLLSREERLMVALHDAICRPQGVVPDSALEFYDPDRCVK